MIKFKLYLCISFLLMISGLYAQTVQPFSSVFISDQKINNLKIAVNEQKEPTFSAFEAMRKVADQGLNRRPTAKKEWYVPGYYDDAEGHRTAKNGLRDDANIAYAQALCYRITTQKKYARSAIRLINGWVKTVKQMSRKDDSTLSFSYHFPAFVFAADLLRNDDIWPKDQENMFAGFLRDKASPMSCMDRENNWGNWGLVLSAACAVYLKDAELFNTCIDRWQYFIENQIADDGHMPHEVNRSGGMRGIWYTHFSLMPQTVAAEILRVNGEDLYHFVSPGGHTLKQAFKTIAGWTRRPEEFPYWEGDPNKLTGRTYISYFEILNAHWPNEDAVALLNKFRPATAGHSAPFLTFTHGQPLDN